MVALEGSLRYYTLMSRKKLIDAVSKVGEPIQLYEQMLFRIV
jgi:hypothetical protein